MKKNENTAVAPVVEAPAIVEAEAPVNANTAAEMVEAFTPDEVTLAIVEKLVECKHTMRSCAGRHDREGSILYDKSRPGFTVKSDGKKEKADIAAYAYIKAVALLVSNKVLSQKSLDQHEAHVNAAIAAKREAGRAMAEAKKAAEAAAE